MMILCTDGDWGWGKLVGTEIGDSSFYVVLRPLCIMGGRGTIKEMSNYLHGNRDPEPSMLGQSCRTPAENKRELCAQEGVKPWVVILLILCVLGT